MVLLHVKSSVDQNYKIHNGGARARVKQVAKKCMQLWQLF